jgi:hypothetical protein
MADSDVSDDGMTTRKKVQEVFHTVVQGLLRVLQLGG